MRKSVSSAFLIVLLISPLIQPIGTTIANLSFAFYGIAGTDPSPLTNSVSSICAIGVPGPLWALNDIPVPVAAGDEDTTPIPSVVVMASSMGNGHVVAVGHEGFFVKDALELFDNKRFGNNIVDWLDKLSRRKVLVMTGHGELYSGSNFDAFKSELESREYIISRFSGRLDASVLSDVGVVLIGNAWGTIFQSEINVLRNFVVNGGGLFLIGLGWSWIGYNPGKTLDDYPMNKVGEIFGIRWIDGYIVDSTNNYNGQPIFHTFYPNIELQTLYQVFTHIETVTSAHPSDLALLLQNNASVRGSYTRAHIYLATASMELSQESPQRQEIYVFYKNLISSYPQYFRKSVVYNKVSQSTMAWIRERVYRSFISALIYGNALTGDRKIEIATVIGLTGRYLDIWNEFSVLLLDNTGLNERQKDFIYTLLNLIPQDLHNLHSISVIDNLGKLPSPTPEITLWGKNDGVNIFNIDIGAIQENGFPADVSPKFSDVFCLVVVHEVNHVVDAYSIWNNNVLQDRKMDLIRRAGNTSMNYLRSMFAGDFFTKAPQEFFASISNQWFSDSFNTLKLGITRFSNGYKEPINQFLFFADVYSLGLNQTIFYTLDTKGNITKNHIPLTRDANNHINSLDYDGNRYMFNLDSGGNVLSINVSPINLLPIARFEYSPDKPRANEQITFNASASYSPKGIMTSYQWDFGDNNTTTVAEPIINHIYQLPGKYNVALKVTDNNTLWNTMTKTITVYYITDLNKDLTVNIQDIFILAKAWQSKVGDPKWNATADINKDGWVNIYDIFLTAKDYGKTL